MSRNGRNQTLDKDSNLSYMSEMMSIKELKIIDLTNVTRTGKTEMMKIKRIGDHRSYTM